MPDPIKRLHYFNHQFLRVEDFEDEQVYHLTMRRQHNQLLHTWGVANGLDLQTGGSLNRVTVTQGMAIDELGREIVLTEDTATQDLSGFAGQTVYVTIAYGEQQTDPTSETGAAGNRRWAEVPVVDVSADAPESPGRELILGRVTVADDGTLSAADAGAGLNQRRAAGVVAGDLNARSLVLSAAGVPSERWPRMQMGAAERVDLTGSLRVTSDASVERDLRASRDLTVQRNSRVEGTAVFSGPVGLGVTDPGAALHLAGGRWSLDATEGDLKIGNANYRLKIGVATSGAGAGDVRIRAQGGSNRLLLGGGTTDAVVIGVDAQQNGLVGIGAAPSTARLHVAGLNQWNLTSTDGDLTIGNATHKLKLGIALGGGGAGMAGIRSTNRLALGSGTTEALYLNTDGSAQFNGSLRAASGITAGPFSIGAVAGRLEASGPSAELSLMRRTLTAAPAALQAGDRFVWYNPDGTARLFTEATGDILLVDKGGRLGIGAAPSTARLHVAGLNQWNLTSTDGDLTIGNATHKLKLGIALGGGGAGMAGIRSTNRLALGSGTTEALYLNTDGSASFPGNASFGSQTRQMLNLWNTNYGIGVQAYTLYLRTDRNLAIHQGGAHDDAALSAGTGGNPMLTHDRRFFTVYCHDFLMGGIRRATPGRALVDGTNTLILNYGSDWANGVQYFGALSQGSSREIKDDIRELDLNEALAILKDLRPVRFHLKADSARRAHLGFIAEDVPEQIATEDRKAVTNAHIVAVLTRVVHEQQRILAELTSNRRNEGMT